MVLKQTADSLSCGVDVVVGLAFLWAQTDLRLPCSSSQRWETVMSRLSLSSQKQHRLVSLKLMCVISARIIVNFHNASYKTE